LRGGDQPVVFPSLFVRARKKYVFPFAQLAADDARRVHGHAVACMRITRHEHVEWPAGWDERTRTEK
jgi:hypothetical protein